MIASGSSERGLSLVTITTSASCARPAPSAAACRGRGRRRRRRRRSARPSPSARAARSTVRARRACARSRRRRRTAGPRRPPRSDRDTPHRGDAVDDRRRRRRRAAARRATAPSTFSTLKTPSSGVSIVDPGGAEPRAAARRARGRRRAPRRLRRSPNVTSGARPRSTSSSASRRPYGSPTFTAAGGGVDAGEQPALRLEVLLHVAVQVEVILREVREDERVEADAVEPREVRAVRRRLERDRSSPASSISRKSALQLDRLGRRVRRGSPLAADDPLDRPDEARSSGPRASRIERSRNVVVDLPFVPVTPATSSARSARRRTRPRRSPSPRARLDDELRHVERRAAARRRARPHRPRPPRRRGRARPRATPGTQKKQRPVATRRRRTRGRGSRRPRRRPLSLAREHARQLVELHASPLLHGRRR